MGAVVFPSLELAPVIPHDQGAPHFNGPAVFGASPNHCFHFRFPVRGERPVRFSIEGALPPGVSLNPETGILSGNTSSEGDFPVKVHAKNSIGEAERLFTLRIGKNARCQTPLLGWTSWNAWGCEVTQARVLEAAHALVDLGLSSRGFDYVNTDSFWQGSRDPKTSAIQPGPNFPDIAGMVEEIHSLGLHAGIYSTPMVVAWGSTPSRILPGSTGFPLDPEYYHSFFGGCGKCSYEAADAAQWADWKFDYLKYDWPQCDLIHTMRMRQALDQTGREFIFSLTTDGKLELAAEYPKYAQMVRSNPDTMDTWPQTVRNAKPDAWMTHSGPGCWFDLDMLAIGRMQLGRKALSEGMPADNHEYDNRMTHDEQLFHYSFWAFLPSPIQLSCNLTQLDDFQLRMISNEEILAINQDERGQAATFTEVSDAVRVYERTLSGNRQAWGFFNYSEDPQDVDFALPAELKLRDPWMQQELGTASSVHVTLPPHGARILVGR